MQVKKFAKWGLALTSSLVLGGVVAPVGGQLLNTTDVVYAQEAQAKWDVMEISHRDEDGNELSPTEFVKIYEGGSITIDRVDMGGYVPIYAELGDDIKLTTTVVSLPYIHKYVGTENGYGVFGLTVVYKPVETPPAETLTAQPTETPAEKPVETPTDQPVEQPVEKPVETPTDQPVETPAEQPISVLIGAISEVDGPLSHYYVTINPGETKTVETPKVDGYKLDQYTSPTYEITYDNALKQLNSAGFAWVQFWMIKDAASESPAEQPVDTPAEKPVEQPVETPVEQPTEQPAETLAEKPVEQVVDTPTDKPVEQLTDASSLTDQTAGKAQPVATTDKKKVDTSTPSTSPVASQDTAKTTAKSLPKTGDSGSILLGLGGFLSGLSGLGLAATSRKKD
ncbi:LPXTG cell wall anchor domain-containing protein [Streptococcus suis]|nr:LPXTG cell wall anchor domain-containing protein [Streptococcus suis]